MAEQGGDAPSGQAQIHIQGKLGKGQFETGLDTFTHDRHPFAEGG